MTDPVQFVKEEIRIEGGRRLWRYTFTIADEQADTPASEPTGNLTKQEMEEAE